MSFELLIHRFCSKPLRPAGPAEEATVSAIAIAAAAAKGDCRRALGEAFIDGRVVAFR
jgi:hypothetical protein